MQTLPRGDSKLLGSDSIHDANAAPVTPQWFGPAQLAEQVNRSPVSILRENNAVYYRLAKQLTASRRLIDARPISSLRLLVPLIVTVAVSARAVRPPETKIAAERLITCLDWDDRQEFKEIRPPRQAAGLLESTP